ncbi:hypothetical protein N8813_03505 [bacterium]|nr:hypothetical protein [bacterium]MDC0259448.1 hypothetical protein [Verrucomicrobiales bacterium]
MPIFVRHAQADEAGKALHLKLSIIPGNPAGDFSCASSMLVATV